MAQECNDGKLLDLKKKYLMNPAKLKALKGSTKVSGEEEKERQAYILEDKPKLLKKVLNKVFVHFKYESFLCFFMIADKTGSTLNK